MLPSACYSSIRQHNLHWRIYIVFPNPIQLSLFDNTLLISSKYRLQIVHHITRDNHFMLASSGMNT